MLVDRQLLRRVRSSRSSQRLGRWRALRALRHLETRSRKPRVGEAASYSLALAAHDSPIRDRAAGAILSLISEDPGASQVRDGIVAAWAETRSGRLAKILKETVLRPTPDSPHSTLTLLAFDPPHPVTSGQRASAVIDHLADGDSAIRSAARTVLEESTAGAVWNVIGRRWAAERTPDLRELLLLKHRVPDGPPDVRLLVRLLIGDSSIRSIGPDGIEMLRNASADPDVGEQAQATMLRLANRAAHTHLCLLALQGRDWAREVCIAAGYLPEEDHERALFLFLTEQWDRYEVLDFDSRLLGTAYEVVDEETRRRIRETAGRSSRTSALRVILGGNRSDRIRTLSETEIEFLLRQLEAAEDFAGIWRLAFELPLLSSLDAIRILRRQRWHPESMSDQSVFAVLIDASTHLGSSVLEQMRQELPIAVQRAVVTFNGRINALAFQTGTANLVIGSNQRRVGVWDMSTACMRSRHDGFNRSIGHLASLDDGTLLAAERTNNVHNTCQIWLKPPNMKFSPLGTHRGSITGLTPIGGSLIATGGRDSRIKIWNGTSRSIERELPLPDWPRSMHAFSTGGRIGVVHTGITIVNALTGSIGASAYPFERVPSGVAVAPDTEDLVIGFHNGSVIVMSTAGPQPRYTGRIRNPAHRVSALAALRERRLVLVGDRHGGTHVFAWPSRTHLGTLDGGEGVTSLTVSPTEGFMAIGHPNDQTTLWDLRVGSLPGLVARPLIETTPASLSVVDAALDARGLSPPVHTLLTAMRAALRHRFRHDIEIDRIAAIRAGRYDIAID